MSITDSTVALGSTIAGRAADAVSTAADRTRDVAHDAAGMGRSRLESIGLIEAPRHAGRRRLALLLMLIGIGVIAAAAAKFSRAETTTPEPVKASEPTPWESTSSPRVV